VEFKQEESGAWKRWFAGSIRLGVYFARRFHSASRTKRGDPAAWRVSFASGLYPELADGSTWV
jgi:hypothetical protein